MHLPVIIIFIGGTNLTIPILMGGTHGIVKNPEKNKGIRGPGIPDLGRRSGGKPMENPWISIEFHGYWLLI